MLQYLICTDRVWNNSPVRKQVNICVSPIHRLRSRRILSAQTCLIRVSQLNNKILVEINPELESSSHSLCILKDWEFKFIFNFIKQILISLLINFSCKYH